MSLNTAHVTRRKAVVQSLLRDFTSIENTDNTGPHMQCCLSLMFEIFRDSKVSHIRYNWHVIILLMLHSNYIIISVKLLLVQ